MNRIRLRETAGSDTLAGKSAGLRDLPKLMAAVQRTPEGSTVVLDWSDVEIATASYIGSTFMVLLRMAISGDLDRYFILTGMNGCCLDELGLVLDLQGHAVLVGEIGRGGKIHSVRVIGKIEASHLSTFTEVAESEALSASQLFKRSKSLGQAKIGKTGWINRLNTLHRERLLRRTRIGREFVFQAPEKEFRDGSRLGSQN
jgi:hypothetical protein